MHQFVKQQFFAITDKKVNCHLTRTKRSPEIGFIRLRLGEDYYYITRFLSHTHADPDPYKSASCYEGHLCTDYYPSLNVILSLSPSHCYFSPHPCWFPLLSSFSLLLSPFPASHLLFFNPYIVSPNPRYFSPTLRSLWSSHHPCRSEAQYHCLFQK